MLDLANTGPPLFVFPVDHVQTLEARIKILEEEYLEKAEVISPETELNESKQKVFGEFIFWCNLHNNACSSFVSKVCASWTHFSEYD